MGGIYPKPPPVPEEFHLTRPRFDLSTFAGRWMQFQQSTDFRTLWTPTHTITEASALLAKCKAGGGGVFVPPGSTPAQLWEARRIVEATCHPETGEPITGLFRFAAFAPANIPLCTLLLWPNPAPAMSIFAQWLNQSYNVAVNYANRNMSNPIPPAILGGSYVMAVASSCSIAVGLNRLAVRRGAALPRIVTRGMVPWTAVVAAGCANVIFIRWNELMDGIELTDESGEVSYGLSIAAGQLAIAKCCAARAIWNTPIMIGTPLIMAPLMAFGPSILARNAAARMGAELVALTGILWAVIPAALAVFPQRDSMAVEDLEPAARAAVEASPNPPSDGRVYFNKGL